VDAAENASEPVSYTWTVVAPPDTTPPTVTLTADPVELSTTSTSITFTFTADEEASFECALDAADFAECTSPVELDGLELGQHVFRVKATDLADNTSALVVHTWTIVAEPDTTAPVVNINSGPDAETTATSATFEFSADEDATFYCSLDGAEAAECTSPKTYDELALGEHTFTVYAVDAAGNVSEPVSYTWTVIAPPDTTAPTVSLTADPAELETTSTSITFNFIADEEATFECALDDVAFATCTSPVVLEGLALGEHVFRVKATDLAGNTSETVSHTWTVKAPADTTPPETTILTGPPASTYDTSATFTFASNEAGSTFECLLDGAAFTTCTSPVELTGLSVGSHTFRVRAIDAAGNIDPTPASYTWTILEYQEPVQCDAVTLLAAADAWVNQQSANTNYGSSNLLNVQSFNANRNARTLVRFDLSALPDGCEIESAELRLFAASATNGRSIQVLTLNDAWNESSVTWNNQPSAGGAVVSVNSGTGWRTWDVTQHVLNGANNGFLMRDSTENQNGGARTQQYHSRENSNVPELVITFKEVTAPDITPPVVEIIEAPASPTTATTAQFTFTANEPATFECSLDGAPFANCVSPASYSGLSVGSHTFQVRATDTAGNTSQPLSYTWTIEEDVDTTPPETSITSYPPAETTLTTASFSFTSNEAGSTFECSLDGADFEDCTSPKSYDNLSVGWHTFLVRATDPAGNTDPTPAAYDWMIVAPDTTPPDTDITSAPEDPTYSTSATFHFSGSDNVTPAGALTFECSLGGAEFTSCTSPVTYSGLSVGSHTFAVRAKDAAGNVDPTPATYSLADLVH
jgi:large repetitive protein